MNSEDRAMAYSEPSSILPPSSRQPSRNRGRLSTMTVTPMGTAGIRWLTIWARPVMPPKAMLLGS